MRRWPLWMLHLLGDCESSPLALGVVLLLRLRPVRTALTHIVEFLGPLTLLEVLSQSQPASLYVACLAV